MKRRPRIRRLGLAFGLVLLAVSTLRAQQAPGERVDFARQVLPVLSNKCFVCHGPDARDKDLVRLDSFEGATRDLGGYRAIDVSAPGKSRLLARIHDPDDPMPPVTSHKTLTDVERELLTRWIHEGGRYARHWAFVPPRRGLPDGSAMTHPVDAFVGKELARREVDFAPSAERGALARRAALVLTGLPPEPLVLEEFLADRSGAAFDKLVDRLLASPRYGEHAARYWLDAVRYGDTHGLHLDNRRGIYPYRDWVVRAFNDDLPLDDFITWQLAGDLLPEPTVAQLVATGFVRMNPTTAEGGAIPAEFQAKNNFDRTENFGTVMLGMTMTCARCHTHKYDPITQQDYYRLLAFFNNTSEAPMDGNRYAYAPVVSAPSSQRGWDEWSAIESEMIDLVVARGEDVQAAVAYAKESAAWTSANWRMSKPAAVDGEQPAPADLSEAKGLPGVLRKVKVEEGEAIWILATFKTPVAQTLDVVMSGSVGSGVWLAGEPVGARKDEGARRTRYRLSLSAGTHAVRMKVAAAKRAVTPEVRIESPWTPLAKAGSWSSCGREQRLAVLADPRGAFGGRDLQERAAALAGRVAAARRRFTTTLVARERAKPRETRMLERGEYDLPVGEPLNPAIPPVMGQLPAGAPRNRRGLARWLTSRDNPLVARVFVNRLWQQVFGAGLVRTPEDFGLQGQQPTHPGLLDWLAVELQESGWSVKHMLRLMLTSRTFQQSSAWRRDLDDPRNLWLARGPRHRLDAEVIRDIALWASGALDPFRGGEGVKPWQPEGMWAALAHPASNTKRYVADQGDKIRRRSLYVYWKRTSPHPMMTLFDAPSRESSCVRRSRTNTPLQSLALLNEVQRLELSATLAERLLREGGSVRERLDLLFRLLACREPTLRERSACGTLLRRMRGRYADSSEDAAALLGRSGDRAAAPADVPELAAWTQVVVAVLASDIAIMLY